MNISKEARKDALEWAQAMMASGEGAGLRRRYIAQSVEYKAANLPGYQEAFEKAHNSLDKLKVIDQAKRSRRRKDAAAYLTKNTRAIARNDRRNMSAIVFVGFTAGIVLHETGYDKVLIEKAKVKTRKARAWLKSKL